MKRSLFFPVLFLLCLGGSIWSDSRSSKVGVALEIVQPFRSFDISETIFAGLNIKGKLHPTFGGNLSFHYLRTTYFGHDVDSGWYGPDSLSNINPTGSNWIFYQTEWVIALNLSFYLPMSKLQPYFHTGPAWISFAKSEAADYYPEFNDHFSENMESTNLFLGYITRLGMEYFMFEDWTFGFDLMFKVDRVSRFFDDFSADPGTYIARKSHLAITCTYWPL